MQRPEATTDAPGAEAAIFAALGDPTRLQLLDRMGEREPRSIAQLSEGLTISRQAVTKHLRVLEGAGLVTMRREGRESRYAPRAEAILSAQAYLNRVTAQWESALARLARHIEKSPD